MVTLTRISCLLLFIFISLFSNSPLFGQTNGALSTEDSDKVIRKIRFVGNDNVKTRTLRTLTRTQTNREFLGIPGFTPWYFINRVTNRFGEEPSLLNRSVVANDLERIRLYYESIGFFSISVDTTIIEYNPKRVEVSFLISEGRRSQVRTIGYTGFPDFGDPELVSEFMANGRLTGTPLSDSTFQVQRSYNAQDLRLEQTRIINFLKNYGYAAVQRDSVLALIKPDKENPLQLDVLFSIQPGNIYHFGDVFIDLSGPGRTEGFDEELIIDDEEQTDGIKLLQVRKQDSAQTRFSLLTDQILFKPGDVFNQSLYLRSINEFQNLGMLSIRRFGLSEDGSLPDYTRREIPVYFDLQTLPKHSISTEFFGMRRYGFGSGAGINYNNNNLFGRAENLTIGFNTNFEYVTSRTLREIRGETSAGSAIFSSFEARADYTIPRLNFPFSRWDKRPFFINSRTRYSLSYNSSNQLLFDINSDVRFNVRYEVNHSPRYSSFLDLLELEIVDADPSSEFRQSLINEFGEDSFEFQRILEDFRSQFSSTLRYTFRNQNTNLIKRNFGYFSEYSVAFGGTIPYVLDRFIITPGVIEGTLPSPLGISENNLAYSRFIKFSADYRRYFPVTPETVFAFRGFAGYALPIGESETIPLNRRFFAGGSNDIRGWAPFRLGPGSISQSDVTINGGEIKLAAFTELRQIFFRDVLSADWQLAWYTDAGNVWYGPKNTFRGEDDTDILEEGRFKFDNFYNQIAVGSGLGLRLDWNYIIVRFDFTYRIHDLQLGWFENNNMYFSFGIGHSF